MLKTYAELSRAALEVLGIAVICVIALYATLHAIYLLLKHGAQTHIFSSYRHSLARGILLGLELLVAADIIRTVAIEITFQSVGVLSAIVLIRTFLSFTLEVETTGRWPWQKKNE